MKRPEPDSNNRFVSEIARGFALFLGGFIGLGLMAQAVTPGFDLNLWWVDLRALPVPVAVICLALLSLTLLAHAVRPQWLSRWTWPARGVLGLFLVFTLVNAIVFWRLLAGDHLASSLPIPLSLVFTVGLMMVWFDIGTVPRTLPRWRRVFGAGIVFVLSFPLLQCLGFGKTDYRRPADVAVVFGARAYANGLPSDALADRVRTACQLYHEGMARRLWFSGGPGDGAVHETEAMRNMAIREGVPASAISVDPAGLNTAATVRNTAPALRGSRVIAVSEFYHLPRIKLAYQRAGVDVLTVPAKPGHLARAWAPASTLREIPAFWSYCARATIGRL